ncbi:MAG: ABC transporter ATP-binding protein [Candidatus Brocadiales bacterium]|nr:ABC transporter ATP-binding protein [Candidatus Brocadiales bacterium]
MIEIEDVSKRYGDKLAVEGLNLTVKKGEFFALIGPNGAGKTTTVKMLVGLLRPSSGRIRICGLDISRDHVLAKARLSYVPDQPYLYEKLSGREFLEFVGSVYRMEGSKCQKEIEKWVELFELRPYVDELCESYSQGMKQRLVLSAALLHEPEVLVVDEPMVGLDPKTTRIVKEVLREKTRSGVTVFMCTHVLSVAEELAERVGIIQNGRLTVLGTLQEIRGLAHSDKGLEDIFLKLTGAGDGRP